MTVVLAATKPALRVVDWDPPGPRLPTWRDRSNTVMWLRWEVARLRGARTIRKARRRGEC